MATMTDIVVKDTMINYSDYQLETVSEIVVALGTDATMTLSPAINEDEEKKVVKVTITDLNTTTNTFEGEMELPRVQGFIKALSMAYRQANILEIPNP